ncbi:MAG: serine/threonine protein kinase [Anaerolineaceae bacterium]|nr:MAG: serine/threonine protein kinase [Anaerolineaceae bacterium]
MTSPNSQPTILKGRYHLISQLASGGMAVVYKGVDQKLGRTVAVKILRPSLTADPVFITRFENEARSIANLSHPNIVIVHDVDSDGATNYIVMELVDGSDLKKVIRTHGALPLERMMNLSIQICKGLGFAHRARIVHADVKPQNVLLTKNDVVKITDFGIAQALSDTQPAARAEVVWGSPHYFAPEQAQGEKPTAAADVYSIGIVMFEMLAGRLPYTGASQQDLAMAHIQAPIPDVRDFNPSVPADLAIVIKKVMSKKPNDRYNGAGKLEAILRDLHGQMSGQTAAPARSPQAPAPPDDLPTAPQKTPPEAASGRPVPPPPASMPTQRYNIAPDAPQQATRPPQAPPPHRYNAPPRGGTSGMHPARVPGGDSQRLGDSQGYSSRYREEVEPEFQWDGVTVALGFLALMAVMCLVPLYIVAFSAQLGG